MLKAIVLAVIITGLGISALNQAEVSGYREKTETAIAQFDSSEQGE
jgi:hypothetical protein